MLRTNMAKVLGEDDVTFGDDPNLLSTVTTWVSTGFAGVDAVFGGGFAGGRISEIFGPEGAGKSALMHMAIKNVQDMGGVAVLFDFEGALDPARIDNVGIDMSSLIYARPDAIEDAFDALLQICKDMTKKRKANIPILVVLDSLASAPPRVALDEEGNNTFGPKARTLSEWLPILMKPLQRANVHFALVNQERENLKDTGRFKTPHTPGGRAVKFYSSQRVRVTAAKYKRGSGDTAKQVGLLCTVRGYKARLAVPQTTGKFVINFKRGPSLAWTVFEYLRTHKLMTISGSYYAVPWSDLRIRRAMWLRVWRDDDFRARALDMYNTAVRTENTHDADDDTE